jgi:hypothetical protein
VALALAFKYSYILQRVSYKEDGRELRPSSGKFGVFGQFLLCPARTHTPTVDGSGVHMLPVSAL